MTVNYLVNVRQNARLVRLHTVDTLGPHNTSLVGGAHHSHGNRTCMQVTQTVI